VKAINVILVLFLSVCLLAAKGYAVEVENLYTGKVLVTDKTTKTRVKAHRWAIEQVFTKVTGNRDILENKRIQSVVRRQAANYIKSFTFVTDEQERIFLVDVFDQKRINMLLREVKASIWGKRRPQTLIWLAIEENLSRSILEPTLFPQLAEFVLRSADDRGLPILLPDPDRLKTDPVYVSDVWARFERPILEASQSYPMQNYVMARMRYINAEQSEDNKAGWQLQYQLMEGRQALYLSEVYGDQFNALMNMVNELADYFASQYAIKSEKLISDKLEVTVSNISNVIDLVKAENLLLSLTPVSQVTLNRLVKQEAYFSLKLSGEALDVIKALSLQPEFEEIIRETVQNNEPSLTNEERLAKLTQDYLTLGEGKVLKDDSTDLDSQPANLSYRWLGQK
jgi:hypothetical protein